MRDLLLWLVLALPVLLVNQITADAPFAWWEIALGVVVVGAAVLLRVRHPFTAVVVALTAWAAAMVSRPESPASASVAFCALLLGAGYAAGRRITGQRDALFRYVLVAAVLSVLVLVVSQDPGAWLVTVIGAVLFGLVPWLLGAYHQQYRALVRAGWQHAERLEHEQRIISEQARLRERTRIAGEMHDLLGHQLSLVALRIGALEVAPDLAPEHQRTAGQARGAVTAAAERLREVVEVLREDGPPLTPGTSAAEIVEHARRSGMEVSLHETGTAPESSTRHRAACRIVQEALTNAAKHAPGQPVAVHLAHDERRSTVSVRNPLPAEPVEAPGGGFGLVALAERVRLAGGGFDAGADGGEFAVTAELPQQVRVPETDSAHRWARAEGRMRSSRNTALATAAASAVGLALLSVGLTTMDTVTSVLPARTFDELRIGQSRADIAPLLPARTRMDDAPEGDPPRPAGSRCEFYSTHANPFDAERGQLHRLCFRDGVLVDKDLLR
ncbi:histidine kinase [Saccharopolyspora cebuensis]